MSGDSGDPAVAAASNGAGPDVQHRSETMKKRVLDVGQCGPDHLALRKLVEDHFDAEVVQAHLPADALDALRRSRIDLVLVNRKLDADYTDGLEIIRQIKADRQFADIPCMLITNFAEHQELAVAAGAEPGFGKLELDLPATVDRLLPFIGPRSDA